MNIKLRDGETVRGWIEYFDDSMLRLTREGQPNLFIYKNQIRTITEAGRRRTPRYELGWTAQAARGGICERRGRSGDCAKSTYIPKAAEIAREAGARLREFFAQGVETEYKGDVDIVTVADRTVEKLIRTRLGEAFPDHGVYGEEGTRERMEGEFRWYVDPLDGTTNFAHGFPQFCVSMGLETPAGGPQARARTARWWLVSSTIPCATSYSPPNAAKARG